MENQNKISKVILYFTVIFFIFWLGGYIARHLVIYQYFEPENLTLRELFTKESLPATFYLILPLIIFNIFSYVVFLVLFIIFLIISKFNLKLEGWLLIVSLIVFITAPFEIFLLIKDYKIVKDIYYNLTNAEYLISLIRERITILSSFSLIEIFSYLGIVFLVIFKPLRKQK